MRDESDILHLESPKHHTPYMATSVTRCHHVTSHAMTTTRTNITAIATVTEKVAVTKGVSKLKDLQQLYNVGMVVNTQCFYTVA